MSRISDLVGNLVGDPHYNSNAIAVDKSCIKHRTAACLKQLDLKEKAKEAVDHPLHYKSKTGLEAIDVIEAFDLNFNLGNVIKYILRCGKKDAEIQELEKAKWYLEHEISNRSLVKDEQT